MMTGLAMVLTVLVSPRASEVQHVLIVGVDGLSPDGIRNAPTPHLDRLCRDGAWTFRARAVMPTSSSPNWASLMMGAGPEQHGILSNDWRPDRHELPPTVLGPGGIFPTLFSVLRQQRPDAVQAVVHDWDGFGRLFERSLVDVVENPAGPTNTTRRAVELFRTRLPTLLFVHLDHVDGAGHQYGHGSAEYYESVAMADQLLGELLTAVRDAGREAQSLVLVTSDHGGLNKGHGGATLAEIEIPWIIAGPGVRRGHEIQIPVNIFDTAPTVAYALRLKRPAAWIGRPVSEAFVAGAAEAPG